MNPLIFFLAIFGINTFLKSIDEKKKIEEARQKRMKQLKTDQNVKPVKPVKQEEIRVKRKLPINPSLSSQARGNDFFGENIDYKEDHSGYKERYEDRYKSIEKSYSDISSEYDSKKENRANKTLEDPNAIQSRARVVEDIRDYGKSKAKIDIPIPKASTFKEDVLNGIIFSEILGKPKSMQKRDI